MLLNDLKNSNRDRKRFLEHPSGPVSVHCVGRSIFQSLVQHNSRTIMTCTYNSWLKLVLIPACNCGRTIGSARRLPLTLLGVNYYNMDRQGGKKTLYKTKEVDSSNFFSYLLSPRAYRRKRRQYPGFEVIQRHRRFRTGRSTASFCTDGSRNTRCRRADMA